MLEMSSYTLVSRTHLMHCKWWKTRQEDWNRRGTYSD